MIALLRNEEGADHVRTVLAEETSGWFAHGVNICEVFYNFLRRGDQSAAREAVKDLRSGGMRVREDLDEVFWEQAGWYKVQFHMSLADAFLLSLAKRLGAEVLTSDRKEFGPVAQAGLCRVRFFR